MTSAASVANAFLDIQAEDQSVFPRIDQMKMQKLLYYAHAWHLALRDTPLFDDDVEAWPWGPVVRSVYGDFRHFGRQPIAGSRATELVRIGPGPLQFQYREPPPVSEDTKAFLRSVWNAHKNMTGVQLSNATHAAGEPWSVVLQSHGNLDDKPRIPNEVIRDIFKRKLAPAPA